MKFEENAKIEISDNKIISTSIASGESAKPVPGIAPTSTKTIIYSIIFDFARM